MKTLLFTLLLGITLISCNSNPKNDNEAVNSEHSEETSEEPSLKGTWELVGFSNYNDNEVIDSFNTRDGYRQVKMYTDSKVMWSKSVPVDSSEWFGYGSYKLQGETLSEMLDYGSAMMSKIIEEKKEFIYEIHLTQDTFSQIELDEDGNRIYSENYKRIE